MRPSLELRTLTFSRDVIKFCKSESISFLNRSLFDQLIRSATSIGANYMEAKNAPSKADFKNKLYIAKKEAVETRYWLSLLTDLVNDKDSCVRLHQEAHYILMMLQKSVNTVNGQRSVASARKVARG